MGYRMNSINKREDKLIIRELTLADIVFYLAILASALSFCPNPTISRISEMVMYGLWAAVAVLLIFSTKLKFNNTLLYMLAVYCFAYVFIQLLYLSGFYRTNGMGAVGYLLFCFAFYFIGYNFPLDRKKNIVYGMIISYVVAHVIFTVLIYVLLQGEKSDAKNMSGQILGIGVVLETLFIPKLTKNKIIRLLSVLFAVFSVFTLFNLHSRTPFIAMFVVLLFAFFQKKRPVYMYLLLFVFAIGVYIFFSSTAKGYELFQEFIIGDHRYESADITDVDVIMSGRPSLYLESIYDILEHPIIGLGAWAYIDCFPINVVRSGGLIIGILVVPFAYSKLFSSIFKYKINTDGIDKDDVRHVLFDLAKCLSIFFTVVSLMEGYPPLGPGASAFYLWIVLGLKDSYLYEKNVILSR